MPGLFFPPRAWPPPLQLLYCRGMKLHIGTSGWSYASWKPSFFPQPLPSKRFLEFYATRLNAVELNATFRRMPTASAIAGWIGATPADFLFAAKVHQSITHFKRLKDADESMRFFLQSMEPMRQSGKLGPILVQTPPNLKARMLTDAARRTIDASRNGRAISHWYCNR